MSDALNDLVARHALEPLKIEPQYQEYHIPALRHRTMTWMGLQTVTYLLTLDEEALPGGRYTVSTDSDYSGGDVVFSTDDIDELDAWITDRVEQLDE